MTDDITPAHSAHEEDVQKLLDLVRTHGKTLLVGVCVAVVAVAGLKVYQHKKVAARAEASRLLAASRSPGDLQDLLAQHASSAAAPLALLKLAKSHFDLGDPSAALQRYEEFTNRYPEHRLASGAVLGKLHCIEAAGSLSEALAGFELFVKNNPESFLMPQALFGQGRCLEQLGRPEEARTLYEDFVAAHPDSAWKANAEEALERIASGASLATPAPLPIPAPIEIPAPLVSGDPPTESLSAPVVETTVSTPVPVASNQLPVVSDLSPDVSQPVPVVSNGLPGGE